MPDKDCKDRGGRYCMCETCQSMREMLEKLAGLKGEDIMGQEEARGVFEEMERTLGFDKY